MELRQDQELTEHHDGNSTQVDNEWVIANRDGEDESEGTRNVLRVVKKELQPFSSCGRTERAIPQDEGQHSGSEAVACEDSDLQRGTGNFVFGNNEKAFDSIGQLERHASDSKGESPLSCDLCGKTFSFKGSLRLHKRIHTDERPYKCEFCGKSFRRKDTLDEHKHIHSKEKPFSCEQCGKFFSSKPNFIRHKRLHKEESPFVCDHCDKMFADTTALEAHECIKTIELVEKRYERKTEHPGKRSFECDECGKSFTLKNSLKDHKDLHKGEKSYSCDVCGKAFAQVAGLRFHKRHIHEGVKYKARKVPPCDQCGKTFSCNVNLQKHKAGHANECDQCGETFSYKESLKLHKRTHPDTRPHKCEHCRKTFRRKDTLNEHKHIHSQEKPFSCKQCGKVFSSRSNFTRHQRMHNKKGPLICVHCGKMFADSAGFEIHVHKCIKLMERVAEKLEEGESNRDCVNTDGLSSTGVLPLVNGKTDRTDNLKSAQDNLHSFSRDGSNCYQIETQQENLSREINSGVIATEASATCMKQALSCDQCGKLFSNKSSLAKHKHIHTGEKPFACEVCGKAFHLKSSLKDHKDIHSGEKLYSCDVCGKAFAQLPGLRAHKKHIHEGKKYKQRKIPPCDQCGKILSSKVNLEKHKLSHTIDNPLAFNQDGKAFSHGYSLEENNLHSSKMSYPSNDYGKGFVQLTALQDPDIHNGEGVKLSHEAVSCEQCGKSFSSKSSLSTHKHIHTGEKRFSCDECGKSFHLKSSLNDHKDLHKGEKSYTCDVCGKAFAQLAGLRNHRRHIHEGVKYKPRKVPPCDQCGKILSSLVNLRKHKECHADGNTFACDQCGEDFSHKRALNLHMIMHSVEMPYPCNDNGKGYVELTALQEGKRYEGVKPANEAICCELCDKSFSTLACLQRHKIIHSSKKPFVCVECGKGFRRRANLEGHKHVHSNQKPFSCNQCGTSFCRKNSLVKHMIKFHKADEPIKCNYCGKTFLRCCSLSTHLQTHTGEKASACYQCGLSFSSGNFSEENNGEVFSQLGRYGTDSGSQEDANGITDALPSLVEPARHSDEVFSQLGRYGTDNGSQAEANDLADALPSLVEPARNGELHFSQRQMVNVDTLTHNGMDAAFRASSAKDLESTSFPMTSKQADTTPDRNKDQSNHIHTGTSGNCQEQPAHQPSFMLERVHVKQEVEYSDDTNGGRYVQDIRNQAVPYSQNGVDKRACHQVLSEQGQGVGHLVNNWRQANENLEEDPSICTVASGTFDVGSSLKVGSSTFNRRAVNIDLVVKDEYSSPSRSLNDNDRHSSLLVGQFFSSK